MQPKFRCSSLPSILPDQLRPFSDFPLVPVRTHLRNTARQVSPSPLYLFQLGRNLRSKASFQTPSVHRPSSSRSNTHFGLALTKTSRKIAPPSSGKKSDRDGSLARRGWYGHPPSSASRMSCGRGVRLLRDRPRRVGWRDKKGMIWVRGR